MKKTAAGSFKTNCPAVMDEVQAKHETVVIYNFLAGKGAVAGDIVSPALSPEEWVSSSISSWSS
jgi:hypothetical protein